MLYYIHTKYFFRRATCVLTISRGRTIAGDLYIRMHVRTRRYNMVKHHRVYQLIPACALVYPGVPSSLYVCIVVTTMSSCLMFWSASAYKCISEILVSAASLVYNLRPFGYHDIDPSSICYNISCNIIRTPPTISPSVARRSLQSGA